MSAKGKTKDELFLLKLHQLACAAGGPTAEVNRYVVGAAVGLSEKAVNAIVVLLAQANFVKKGKEEASLYLTANGLRFIESVITPRAS
jgi:hypothetical protein